VPPPNQSHHSQVALFKQFIEQARPLVIGELTNAISKIRPRLEQMRPWLVNHDLLTVAGASFVEDAYTELVAWSLYPQGNPDVALVCQQAWLSSLGISGAASIQTPTIPHTQFVAKGGRPDIVMDYRDDGFVVVVELKTGSEEHETPRGGMQTEAYPRLVRKSLALPDQFRVEMVFLTPSGILAASEEAINTTYHQFVVSLASAVAGRTLPPAIHWSYCTIFSHLLKHASPGGIDGVSILRSVARLLAENAGELSYGATPENLSELRSSIMLLGTE